MKDFYHRASNAKWGYDRAAYDKKKDRAIGHRIIRRNLKNEVYKTFKEVA